MTGIVVLREGVVESNITLLNERFGLEIAPLIDAKIREYERMTGDDGPYIREIERLFLQLEEAAQSSPLPEDTPNRGGD